MPRMLEDFPWLEALWRYHKQSSYNDLKLYDDRRAFLYDGESSQRIPKRVFCSYFQDLEHYETELMRLAWQLELRFDPYYPYLSHEFEGVGRITLIGKQLLGCGPHLFIRKSLNTCEHMQEWKDPHGYLKTFQRHFLNCPWLICGASGVGKTTLLMRSLKQHFSCKPVVFMDRYQEGITAAHLEPVWTFLREQSTQVNDRGRVDARHLLELAFKLGSEVLVFGEVRHAEVTSFFHGMFSGHKYVYGTFHASSVQELHNRLSLMDPLGAKQALGCLAALFLSKENGGDFVVKGMHLPESISRICIMNSRDGRLPKEDGS